MNTLFETQTLNSMSRATDPDTSHDAAKKALRAGRVNRNRRRILECLLNEKPPDGTWTIKDVVEKVVGKINPNEIPRLIRRGLEWELNRRWSELKGDVIKRVGMERDGCETYWVDMVAARKAQEQNDV